MSHKHVPARIRAKDDPSWSIPDFGGGGGIVTADSEKSYRRGFHQGVAAAVEYFRGGLSVDEADAWLAIIAKWRSPSAEWIKGQVVYSHDPPLPDDPGTWDRIIRKTVSDE